MSVLNKLTRNHKGAILGATLLGSVFGAVAPANADLRVQACIPGEQVVPNQHYDEAGAQALSKSGQKVVALVNDNLGDRWQVERLVDDLNKNNIPTVLALAAPGALPKDDVKIYISGIFVDEGDISSSLGMVGARTQNAYNAAVKAGYIAQNGITCASQGDVAALAH